MPIIRLIPLALFVFLLAFCGDERKPFVVSKGDICSETQKNAKSCQNDFDETGCKTSLEGASDAGMENFRDCVLSIDKPEKCSNFKSKCLADLEKDKEKQKSKSKCKENEELKDGQCKTKEIPKKCPEGQTSIEGICKKEPGETPKCPEGQKLESGKCVKTSTGCPAGEKLIDGKCQKENKSCPNGYKLVNNKCEKESLNCPSGYKLVNGKCEKITTNCPTGYLLVNGKCVKNTTPLCPKGSHLENDGKCHKNEKACNSKNGGGKGEMIWDTNKNAWGSCKIITCNSGFTVNSNKTDCTTSTCKSGYYKSGSKCLVCPKGYKCNKGQKAACDSGSYQSMSGSTECKACNTGYVAKPGSSSCSKCPNYHRPTKDKSSCYRHCFNGYYENGSCKSCPSGYYCEEGKKKICPAGKYPFKSSASGFADICKYCDTDKIKPKVTAGFCSKCPSGTKANSTRTACTGSANCPKGQYKKSGSETCYKCPTGNKCYNSKAYACPKGQYQGKTGQYECLPCKYLGYTSSTGQSKCRECASGKTPTSSHTSCKTAICKPGYCRGCSSAVTCGKCKKGYYCLGDLKIPCPIGYYNGYDGVVTKCAKCPSGKTTKYVGSTTCVMKPTP